MKSSAIITAALFGALAVSGVLMFLKASKAPTDEHAVLTKWPQDVAKAFDEFDLDKLDGYFTDDFKDQEGTNKQAYKAYLTFRRQKTDNWRAVIKSTSVEWDHQTPDDANLDVSFDLVVFGQVKAMQAKLTLKKVDGEWMGTSAEVGRAITPLGGHIPTTIPGNISEQPK